MLYMGVSSVPVPLFEGLSTVGMHTQAGKEGQAYCWLLKVFRLYRCTADLRAVMIAEEDIFGGDFYSGVYILICYFSVR